VPKAFIYTCNILNQIAVPGVLPFAAGKAAAAMTVEYVANAYGGKGRKSVFHDLGISVVTMLDPTDYIWPYRFRYTDKRMADGRPAT
jgi:hypothetical protein